MKMKIGILCVLIVIIVVLFFGIKQSSYDNSQSQCEHYQDSQRQQENIKNELNDNKDE